LASLLQETRLSIAQAAKLLGVDRATVWRWTLRGVQGVRLESILLGGRRFTTRQAVERFVERRSGSQQPSPPPGSTQTSRRRAIDAAEKSFDKLTELGGQQ
jgi:hypothetical protein